YGVGALGERFRARGRALVAAIAAAAIAVELAVPDASRWSFGKTLALAGWQARPPAPEVEFYRSLPDGAVLDLPYRPMAVGMMRDLAHDLLAAAYHQKPTAACYNSFSTPIQDRVRRFAYDLPPAVRDELHRLGFRTFVVHEEQMTDAERARLAPVLADASRLTPIAESPPHRAYRLHPPE